MNSSDLFRLIGKNIQSLRAEFKIGTQEKLAEDLDLSRLNISKNKSAEAQSDNQEELPLVKKQAIEDLVSMKIGKEEATELVNKVYTPDILRDSLVKAAIKARNK